MGSNRLGARARSVAAVGAAGATAPAPGATATARALAVRIVYPDGRVVGSPAAGGSEGSGAVTSPSYAYPVSGSVVRDRLAPRVGDDEGGRDVACGGVERRVERLDLRGRDHGGLDLDRELGRGEQAERRRGVQGNERRQPPGTRPRACLRARQARRLGDALDLASRRRADERGRDQGLHGDGDRSGRHADGRPTAGFLPGRRSSSATRSRARRPHRRWFPRPARIPATGRSSCRRPPAR